MELGAAGPSTGDKFLWRDPHCQDEGKATWTSQPSTGKPPIK